MPKGLIHNPREEHLWTKAKSIAEDAGQKENYAFVMGIFKKMLPDRFPPDGSKTASFGHTPEFEKILHASVELDKHLANATATLNDYVSHPDEYSLTERDIAEAIKELQMGIRILQGMKIDASMTLVNRWGSVLSRGIMAATDVAEPQYVGTNTSLSGTFVQTPGSGSDMPPCRDNGGALQPFPERATPMVIPGYSWHDTSKEFHKIASDLRDCDFFMATDGQWYLELQDVVADEERQEWAPYEVYGPFPTFDVARDFLKHFSSPGGFNHDPSGHRKPPTHSESGNKLISPSKTNGYHRWGSTSEIKTASPHVIYVAAFLTPVSRQKLLKECPALFPMVHAGHMTIAFKPSAELVSGLELGQVIHLQVIGSCSDDKGQAVQVKPVGVNLPIANRHPHITISCEGGVSPVYSNALLSQNPLEHIHGLVLEAVIDTFPRQFGNHTLPV